MTILRRRPRQRSGIRDGDGPQRLPGFRQWVAGFPCLVAGKAGHVCSGRIQAAHVRMGTDGGMGLKPSDWWSVPLCEGAHMHDQHVGDGEREFWERHGVDPKAAAMELFERWQWESQSGRKYRMKMEAQDR